MSAFSISRRTTLQMALAAAMAGRFAGMPHRAVAQDASTGTWNWRGNAGNTGELPGPGLDLGGALGELWRIPREEFSSGDRYSMYGDVAGYANGVIYTHNGDSLWARRLSDGEFLWSQSPAKLLAPATPETSLKASPQLLDEELAFSDFIAIDGDVILVPVSNGHVWGLDAATGNLRWDIVWNAFDPRSGDIAPIIVDRVAYGAHENMVTAVHLDDPSSIRWSVEVDGWIVGVDGGYVYVMTYDANSDSQEIRALSIENGSEYWRAPLAEFGWVSQVLGVANGGIFLETEDDDAYLENLIMIDQDGQVAWNIPGESSMPDMSWVLADSVATLMYSSGGYGNHWLISRYAENGIANWELEVNASRWSYPISDEPVICAGKAYALLRDDNSGSTLLVVIDAAQGEVSGVWGSLAEPMFIADGVMIAKDYDTDEIVAIGSVDAVLQAGGRATVIEDATLRGAPSDTAIERGQVTSGTLVDVTGDSESTNGIDWMPVTVSDTGDSGWLPASVLSGQDGSIRFSPIELWEFGNFMAYPKFSAGTKAEITETVDMRGAPSDTSAQKATLEAGTLVTVTSAPTEDGETEWCPIKVDATGESGWVPVSVLKLVAGA